MTQTYWFGWSFGLLLAVAGATAMNYRAWDIGLALVIAGVCSVIAAPTSLYLNKWRGDRDG